jgi:ribosomal protein S18 acetylase RimI-like enzyme
LILGRLQADGVRTVLLWVLDGNDAAMRLYRRAGFVIAGSPRPLEVLPGRTEQLLRRDLPDPGLPDEVSRSMRHD